MVSQTTTLTRKGQVTIPAEVRRELGLKQGDQIEVERQGDVMIMRKLPSVAERTFGILSRYRLAQPLTPAEERAAFEEAVAAEVSGTDTDEA